MSWNRNSVVNFVLLWAIIFLPIVVFAAPRTFAELAYYLIDLMNYGASLLVILAVVIYFAGAAHQIWKSKNGEAADVRNYLLIGVGIIFVMVSIWGILRILEATFVSGGSGGYGGGTADENCVMFGECE